MSFEGAPAGGEKFKVLIVDDLKNNLVALNGILERDDVDVFQCLSGSQALELLMKHDFCLAILDVKMPVMSGFELAELMRGTKRTKNIPIIFVTATATEQNFSFKGYESGAVDFLLKPLDNHAELDRQKKELDHQLVTITTLMNALEMSKLEAEKENASKSEFLAHMSHEIRTPIGAILGFAELMKGHDNTADENRDYMEIVERNSHQLLRLVDDILDVSKVEAGKMTIENVEFSLVEMLAEFDAVMTLKAEAKSIEFRYSSTTPFPDIISSDPHRLRQILNNVVGNAIKFTAKGKVELIISFTGNARTGVLAFKVVDSGIGISTEQVSRLFIPFSQADESTTRQFGGTGLGLVLSKSLASALGGDLKFLESEHGHGSTFGIEIHSVTLKNAKLVNADAIRSHRRSVAKSPAKASLLRGLDILLVEDSADNQALIGLYVTKEGARVTYASDGEEGVRMALSKKFDVVLMDIQMPRLDGHQATRKLRGLNFTDPIIALTAHAMSEERERCVESGFTDFLTKPIQRDLLIDALARFKTDASTRVQVPV
jgi:signal transduction histidine kinase